MIMNRHDTFICQDCGQTVEMHRIHVCDKSENNVIIDGIRKTTIVAFFTPENEEIMRFEENGDIFVKGAKTDNDKAVVDAMRIFLQTQGYLY